MDRCVIRAEGVTATVLASGAELCSLQDANGTEFLWQAGPVWPRHAPILFPIVGRLAGDTLRHEGQSYRMTQHGFARDRTFAWVEQDETRCRLALTDDESTRAQYPFAFRFEVAYAVHGSTLTTTLSVINTGAARLPASFGWHPAFAWPLAPGFAKTRHVIVFDELEPAPIRRLRDGLLLSDSFPSPVQGRTLHLSETLFEADAMIFDTVASSGLRYGIENDDSAPCLRFTWHRTPQLGLWTRLGNPFLCIEPWRGFASPHEFDGPFEQKPGLIHLQPGEHETVSSSVEITQVAAIKR